MPYLVMSIISMILWFISIFLGIDATTPEIAAFGLLTIYKLEEIRGKIQAKEEMGDSGWQQSKR